MKSLLLCILIFSIVLEVSAQELQFSQPVRLGSDVNGEGEELAPMLSPDKQTLYFSRAFHSKNTGGKYAGTDIWVSRKDANGNWTPAVNAGKPWNNKRTNAVIGLSADGSTVYLTNAYNNKSGISFSRLVLGKWTKPEFIAVPGINRDDLVGIYVHPAFDVMMISMKGGDSFGEEDLYISIKDSLGSWSQPRNLGASINTSGYEISPYLSKDKKRLYFSSNGHAGFGDADIFYSDRLYDSWQTWSVPKNLGNRINTKHFEAYPFVTDSLILFSSNQDGSNLDLYSSKIQIKAGVDFEPIKRNYLNDSEILALSSGGRLAPLEFSLEEGGVSEKHKDKLRSVCRFLLNNESLNLHLVALRPSGRTGLEQSKQRLLEILEFIKNEGIEGSRVSLGSEVNEGEVKTLTIKFEYYN